eukprot:10725227-Alexandrium_andersonii.AAC.1
MSGASGSAPAPKRRAPGDAESETPDDSRPASMSDVSSLVESLRSELSGQLQEHSKKLLEEHTNVTITKVAASTEAMFRKFAEASEVRFNNVEQSLSAIGVRTAALEESQKEMCLLIGKLQKDMAAAEAQLPEASPIDLAEFNREPDRTILRINGPELMQLEEVSNSISAWIESMDLQPDAYKLDGASPGRRFSLRFTGR